jgi:hypothetical protein
MLIGRQKAILSQPRCTILSARQQPPIQHLTYYSAKIFSQFDFGSLVPRYILQVLAMGRDQLPRFDKNMHAYFAIGSLKSRFISSL